MDIYIFIDIDISHRHIYRYRYIPWTFCAWNSVIIKGTSTLDTEQIQLYTGHETAEQIQLYTGHETA